MFILLTQILDIFSKIHNNILLPHYFCRFFCVEISTIWGTQILAIFGWGRNFWSVAILFLKIIISSLADSLKKDSDRLHSNPRLYSGLKSEDFIPHVDTTKIDEVKTHKRRYGQTWWFEILQKFRRYEKSEGTFRGSILAKECKYKLCLDLTALCHPNIQMLWSQRHKIGQNVPYFLVTKCCR